MPDTYNDCGNGFLPMKEVVIAFDVDGTILNNEGVTPGTPSHLRPRTSVNLEVILLIQLLSKKMKNTKIIVWSGGGSDHAEKVVREYGLERYISGCFGKPSNAPVHLKDPKEYDESMYGEVDICFDDVHACELAHKNIIVKMK